MDVTILSPFNTFDIGPLAFQLFTKNIDKNSKIKSFRTKKARIIRQKEGVMHIDGDPVMTSKEIELSNTRSALKVYVPENLSFTDDVQRRINEVYGFFEDRLPNLANLPNLSNLPSLPNLPNLKNKSNPSNQ